MKSYIKYFKITGVLLLIITVIQVFYVFCIPKIIDINSTVPKIKSLFNEKTGLSLDVLNLKIKTYPDFSLSLEANEAAVFDTDGEIVFQAKNPFFKMQPAALFIKKIKISSISSDNLILNFTRFSDKTFGADVFSYKKSLLPFDMDLNGAGIKIDYYKIFFADKYLHKNVSLEGSTFDLEPLSRKLSKLTTDGKLNVDGKIASFNFNIISRFFISKKLDLKDYSAAGKITNIDLQAFAPYLENLWDIKNAKGVINIFFNSVSGKQSQNVAEITLKCKDISLNPESFEKRLLAKGQTEITLRALVNGENLKIENFNFKSDNVTMHAQGLVEKYNKEKPFLNIAMLIAPSKAENIIDLLPFGLCKEINLIKKYGFSADVSGAFKIIGKLSHPGIYGNAEAQNAHALRGIENTHSALIKMRFEDTVVFTDVNLNTDNNQFFKLTGKSYIYDDDWNIFDISTSEALDIRLVRAILVPVSEIFDFPIGPVPQLTAHSGTGSAKMHIKGKKFKKEDSRIDGYVKIKNGSTELEGINALITKLNLDLIFSQEKINFNAQSFAINGYPSFINGFSDTYGNIALTIGSKEINSAILKQIINTSSALEDVKIAIGSLKDISGNINTQITLKGVIDPQTKDFSKEMQNLEAMGFAILQNNKITLKGFEMPLTKLSGKIDFTEKGAKGKNLKASYGNSNINIDIKSEIFKDNKKPVSELKVSGKSLNANDSIRFILTSDFGKNAGFNTDKFFDLNTLHTLNFKCRLIDDMVDIKSIYADINVIPNKTKDKKMTLSQGKINISGGNANINKLVIQSDGLNINLNGQIKDFIAKNPIYSLTVNGSDISVKTVSLFSGFFPENIKNALSNYKDLSGTMSLNLDITGRGANGFIKFQNLSFKHIKSNIPFYFESLPIKITNTKIVIPQVNAKAGRTSTAPLFFNLDIENYMKIPIIRGSAAIKITPAFIERYVNTKLAHPLKINGDVDLSAEINGSVDSLKIFPTLKINKESDISYLAVNFGDSEFMREIKGEITIRLKEIFINKIEYIKYPSASNNKTYALPMWSLKGRFIQNKKAYYPSSLTIITYRKIPAKLLNFIFKKSLIKSGEFSCNLTYQLLNKQPKIFGNIYLENAKVPLYNTTIKNGRLIANDDKIYVSADGRTEDTNYSLNTEILNYPSFPLRIKTLDIKTKYMDLERLINVFNTWSIEAYMNTSLQTPVEFDISDVIIEKGILNAGKIAYKTCPIENFSADFSLDKNSLLKLTIKDVTMSGGKVNGTIAYDFKSGTVQSSLKVRGIDSNAAAESFFGLKNQITGKLDGNVSLSTFGANDVERLKNLNGKIGFHMEDGSMPKLGSVEYLLRASNLIQSALTALSVNNLIELFKPFKTGIFSKISGVLYVNNGTLKNIAVFSQGKTLSIYLTGDYDIVESEADVIVYGKLGKKTEGLLGPIGNISANTLFSLIPYSKNNSDFERELKKIPDIDYKNQDAKFFRATVYGDINDDKVSTSFKWIK